jgi:uncharacterized protein (TIGR00730 family)
MKSRPRRYGTGDPSLDARLREIVSEIQAPDPELTFEMLVTSVRMASAPLGRLDRKLINAALKEMRYAFSVFAHYRDRRKVTTFGSARTARTDTEYALAVEFGRIAAAMGWMVVTGAGPGIMAAVNEGAGQESSFGVNIVLPFENQPNQFIAADPKLMNFRYFFTRKLMFIKEADAFVLFPGGFGTLDELFELLTLIQTGKSDLHPVVMVQPAGSDYWHGMDLALRHLLLEKGFINVEDLAFYHMTESPQEAMDHIATFYRVYHSQRYVGKKLILRLNWLPPAHVVAALNDEFADILLGPIVPVGASPQEIRDDDVVDLPRLSVPFDRVHFGRLRALVDRLNATPEPAGTAQS